MRQLITLTLIASCIIIAIIACSAPGLTVQIQPLSTAELVGPPKDLWVLNMQSERVSVTDWNSVTLGTGWVKGQDKNLPSGAAGLTNDVRAAPLAYSVPDYHVDVTLATGPQFGSVRLSSPYEVKELNLFAPTNSTATYRIGRPFFVLPSWKLDQLILFGLCTLVCWSVLISVLTSNEKRALTGILLASAILFFTWAFYVPIYESPDEVHHWEYSRHLHDYGSLPKISPQLAEANSPPLYYALIAPFAVDTPVPPLLSERTRGVIYQHAPIEYIRYLPLLLARLLTALLSLSVGLAAYLTARELAISPQVALLAAAIAGLLPQHTFRGMSISNDSLVTILAAWAIYGIIRTINRGFSYSVILPTCVAVAGAYLSKINALYLWTVLPIALVVAPGTYFQRIKRLLFIFLPTLIVTPWLLFNLTEYGDIFAREAMRQSVQNIVKSKSISSPYFLTTYPDLLFKSFVGMFGWMNIAMPTPIYWLYAMIGVISVLGSFIAVIRGNVKLRWSILVLWMSFLGIFAITTYINLSFDQPQGRYLFPALGAIAVLVAVGLGNIFGKRKYLYALVTIFIMLTNIYSLISLIYPRYHI